MKKLILFSLLTLLVSVDKVKAEEWLDDTNFTQDADRTVYEHNRKMTKEVNIQPDNGTDPRQVLAEGSVYPFQEVYINGVLRRYINGKRYNKSDYNYAKDNSEEVNELKRSLGRCYILPIGGMICID